MTTEENHIKQLAGLDSYGEQSCKNWELNVERSRLEAEIAHLNYLLAAHMDCCGASRVCTHSMHLGLPENTTVSEASSRYTAKRTQLLDTQCRQN
jgi:hypothetical protein